MTRKAPEQHTKITRMIIDEPKLSSLQEARANVLASPARPSFTTVTTDKPKKHRN